MSNDIDVDDPPKDVDYDGDITDPEGDIIGGLDGTITLIDKTQEEIIIEVIAEFFAGGTVVSTGWFDMTIGVGEEHGDIDEDGNPARTIKFGFPIGR